MTIKQLQAENALLNRALELACIEATKVVGKCNTCYFDFYKECQHAMKTCDQMLKTHFIKRAGAKGRKS